ncbi:MAG: hypothetical protein Q9227_000342 [Pyrenula ochraceoflavens]
MLTLRSCGLAPSPAEKQFGSESKLPKTCEYQELPTAHSYLLCCPSCRGVKPHKKHPCLDLYPYERCPSQYCNLGQHKGTTYRSCERDAIAKQYLRNDTERTSSRVQNAEEREDKSVFKTDPEPAVKLEMKPYNGDPVVSSIDTVPPPGTDQLHPEPGPTPKIDPPPVQGYQMAYLKFQCPHLGRMIMPEPTFKASPKFPLLNPLPIQYARQGDDNKHLGRRALACGCYTGKVPEPILGNDDLAYDSGAYSNSGSDNKNNNRWHWRI